MLCTQVSTVYARHALLYILLRTLTCPTLPYPILPYPILPDQDDDPLITTGVISFDDHERPVWNFKKVATAWVTMTADKDMGSRNMSQTQFYFDVKHHLVHRDDERCVLCVACAECWLLCAVWYAALYVSHPHPPTPSSPVVRIQSGNLAAAR